MSSSENSRQKEIYLKALKRKVQVSGKMHRQYFRGIDACRQRQQDHGHCNCPRYKWQYCDMDCQVCKFWLGEGMLSLDAEMISDGHFTTLTGTIPDEKADVEKILMKAELLDALYRELDALSPEKRKMCELFMDGKSGRESAQIMGMSRATYNRLWRKLKILLGEKLQRYR